MTKKPKRAKGAEAKPAKGAEVKRVESAEEQFIKDSLTRGDAAYVDEEGRLPPGATHEIVEQDAGEPAKIVRRRFSVS
jgi:hypothetical protein